MAALVLATATMVVLEPGGPVAAYPTPNLDLKGHGFGHGRGMGQWGAHGYARMGWSSSRILEHFYGGTSAGTAGNPPIGIELQGLAGQALSVTSGRPVFAAGFSGSSGAWLAVRVAVNRFDVYRGSNCSDVASRSSNPANKAGTVNGPVLFGPSVDTNQAGAALDGALQVCASGRRYRGTLQAIDASGTARTVNTTILDRYVQGVVPSEVPASWPAAALQAQAVAARSYALGRRFASYAQMCDTTACQAYAGVANEAAATTSAVSATSGQVRMLNDRVAVTEYSSSTGGWSAGGTFPAVRDDGDAVAPNPNHDWTASIPVTRIESTYAKGTLNAVAFTRRNGLGDLGGRVLEMRLDFSGGSVTVTGAQFRTTFGLRSDWFTTTSRPITGPSGGVGGYRVVGPDGGLFPFGNATGHGSLGGVRLNQPVVGIADTESHRGYWMVAADGGIFPFGDAVGYGSTGGIRLNQPIVGMAATASGRGYWLVARDGGIFPFGDAVGHGSTGGMRLNQPIVGMAATPSGNGYWLVASDGGIFPFGDARGIGSLGNIRLNQPIVALAATPSSNGYWMVARDGGVFPFGDAPGAGSLPGQGIADTAVSIAGTNSGNGYLITGGNGAVYPFGDAPYFGDIPETVPGYRGGARGLTTQPS